MNLLANATVYVIDDDAGVRDALAWLLRSRRLLSEQFDSGESFEAYISRPAFEVREPSCALLDVRMGALSGLALFDRIVERGLLPVMPVIFLTGHADVPMCPPPSMRSSAALSISVKSRFPTMPSSIASNRR
jgi:two-component system response regulator DctR